MPGPRKTGYFVIEGLNAFSTTLYFYYLYFFLQKEFGFGNFANLCVAALGGAVYALSSWQAGKLAERIGYPNTLKAGFAILLIALLAGGFFVSASLHLTILVVATIGMCLTWPALEAILSEGETRKRLQWMVGAYNLVWAGSAGVAFFLGGIIMEALGSRSIFVIPASIFALQLALAFLMEKKFPGHRSKSSTPGDLLSIEPEIHPHPPATVDRFLKMSWVANPFAYFAINTLLAVTPGITSRIGLSTAAAGIVFSIWFLARFGAFWAFWHWDAWHYRFRWLLAAYVGLVGSFALILIIPNLWVLLFAQVIFGVSIGLIYYSSLFYSMDATEAKGAHGGIHEAAIGLGNFAGPAAGALSLHFFPASPQSGAIAVSLLLLGGLAGMLSIWRKK